MIWSVLYIMVAWFLVGAVAVYFISRTKVEEQRRQQWRKYYVYLMVVSVTILLIASGDFFVLFCAVILALGLREIIRAGKRPLLNQVFVYSLILYATIGLGFIRFALLPSVDEKLWVYALVFVMDGFSQVCGQLFGKRKLISKISPMKTIEGFAGGFVMCVASGFLLNNYQQVPWIKTLVTSVFIALTALVGDLIASYYKRLNGVKDFGVLLPGHGGILDRFDSFITSAALYFYFGRALI